MSSLGIFQRMKMIIPEMYDSNMTRRVSVTGSIKKRNLNRGSIEATYAFIDYVYLYSGIGDITRMYLCNSKITMKELAENISENKDEADVKHVINKVAYDQRKIEALFGKMVLEDIIDGKSNTEEYVERIREERSKAILKGRDDNRLAIKVRDDIIVEEYNGDFVADYGKILQSCSKERLRNLEAKLYGDYKFSGYYNYITSSVDNKSEKAIKDLEMVDSILNSIDDVKEQSDKHNMANTDSIEVNAVKVGLDYALAELADRVMRLEETMEYNKKTCIDCIRLIEESEEIKKYRSGNRNAYVGNKMIVVNELVEAYDLMSKDISIEEIEAKNEGTTLEINIRKLLGAAKKEVIVKGLKYENCAVAINALVFRLKDIEVAFKAIAGKAKDDLCHMTSRYIYIASTYGKAVVMNANEDGRLEKIEIKVEEK